MINTGPPHDGPVLIIQPRSADAQADARTRHNRFGDSAPVRGSVLVGPAVLDVADG
jgi:hypothetical protein